MANTLHLFERELKVGISDLSPDVMRRDLAAFARRSVSEVIASGQAPARYDRYVNNRLGEAEESVQLPGPIVYVFSNWMVAINSALEELKKRVPRRSGRYADSFLVSINGSVVSSFDNIDPSAEVVILNAQPYTRKMETGANGAGARHFDLSKAAFNRRFNGAFNAQMIYLKASGGIDARMPYILKRSGGKRKDRQAGMPITYPALVLKSL